MKKSFFLLTASACVLFLANCSDATLRIKKQGVFSSGGSVTEPVPGTYDETTNWLSATREGNTAHVDHANVFFQIPESETKNPVVFLHGYGQSRTGWQTTPDGREGWADMFLRGGHSVFLVDQPRRASAGMTAKMTTSSLDAWGEGGMYYKPGDQAWYTHFRIGRVPPQRYEGSQFPEGDEAQNQFFRQMTVNTGDYDEKLFGKSLSAVLSDVRKMTGKKSVYITHSQGSRVGWQTDVENIAAIVAIEPGGTPEPDSEEYKKLLAAKIPVAVYFGDYIDNGPSDIQSTTFWKTVRDNALIFAERYNADGGTAIVADLPKEGITGNSHFMFQELNNAQIAAHIEEWLSKVLK
ncbi:MAG: alpha/beta fold hydrolase [Treponema sp.]